MHLFYTPNIASEKYTLPEEESKHAIKVLRLQAGDQLQLVDGRGGFYTASILEDHPKHCQITIRQKLENYQPRNNYLHIAVAPTKNIDRIEWFLEKATEIGIDEITPLLCQHSERKVIKPERLEKIMIAAMKQSYKASLPKLNPLTPLTKLLTCDFQGGKFIAHCYPEERNPLKNALNPTQNLLLIGPEGDFSTEEVQLALQHQFIPVSLGEARLRTETAALVACHTAALMLNK